MNNTDFEKLRQLQNKMIVSALAIPAALLSVSSPLVASAMKAAIRNDELIASLCFMSGKSLEEVRKICQDLPYELADIQAYYRMYGEFPE
jgi:hypothetical protein